MQNSINISYPQTNVSVSVYALVNRNLNLKMKKVDDAIEMENIKQKEYSEYIAQNASYRQWWAKTFYTLFKQTTPGLENRE